MRVTLRHKDIEISPSLRRYLDAKIVRPVERLLKRAGPEDAVTLDIEVERTTRHHRKGQVYRVEANITLGKKMIRAEATDADPRAACDLLEEELKREILTYKSKSRALLHRRARRAKGELRDIAA